MRRPQLQCRAQPIAATKHCCIIFLKEETWRGRRIIGAGRLEVRGPSAFGERTGVVIVARSTLELGLETDKASSEHKMGIDNMGILQ